MESANASGKLVIVPTPIGNLGDMTLRSLEALREADVVCAEDTRVTGKLLAHFGIEKRLARLDEAMIGSRAAGVVERVAAGEVVAYCSDAGMPGVSGRAATCGRGAREAGVAVEVLPGLGGGMRLRGLGNGIARASTSAASSTQGDRATDGAQSFPLDAALSCSTRARTSWWRRFRSSRGAAVARGSGLPRADEAARGGPGSAAELRRQFAARVRGPAAFAARSRS